MPMYEPVKGKDGQWRLLRYESYGMSMPYKCDDNGTPLTFPTKTAADKGRRAIERKSTHVTPTQADLYRIHARRDSRTRRSDTR